MALHVSNIRLVNFLDPFELHRIIFCTVAFDAVKFVYLKNLETEQNVTPPIVKTVSLCLNHLARAQLRSNIFLYHAHSAFDTDCSCIGKLEKKNLEDCGRMTCNTEKKRLLHKPWVKRGVKFQSFVYV